MLCWSLSEFIYTDTLTEEQTLKNTTSYKKEKPQKQVLHFTIGQCFVFVQKRAVLYSVVQWGTDSDCICMHIKNLYINKVTLHLQVHVNSTNPNQSTNTLMRFVDIILQSYLSKISSGQYKIDYQKKVRA